MSAPPAGHPSSHTHGAAEEHCRCRRSRSRRYIRSSLPSTGPRMSRNRRVSRAWICELPPSLSSRGIVRGSNESSEVMGSKSRMMSSLIRPPGLKTNHPTVNPSGALARAPAGAPARAPARAPAWRSCWIPASAPASARRLRSCALAEPIAHSRTAAHLALQTGNPLSRCHPASLLTNRSDFIAVGLREPRDGARCVERSVDERETTRYCQLTIAQAVPKNRAFGCMRGARQVRSPCTAASAAGQSRRDARGCDQPVVNARHGRQWRDREMVPLWLAACGSRHCCSSAASLLSSPTRTIALTARSSGTRRRARARVRVCQQACPAICSQRGV